MYNIFSVNNKNHELDLDKALRYIAKEKSKTVFDNLQKSLYAFQVSDGIDSGFKGIKGFNGFTDFDTFKEMLRKEIEESANMYAVKRPLDVTFKEIIYGAGDPEEERQVQKNVENYMPRIFETAEQIFKDHLENNKDLLSKVDFARKLHNYRVSNFEEKVKDRFRYVNGKYNEKDVTEYVREIFEFDLDVQVQSLLKHSTNLNEDRYPLHSNFYELRNFTEKNADPFYGDRITDEGKNFLLEKRNEIKNIIDQKEGVFDILYNKVKPDIIKNISDNSFDFALKLLGKNIKKEIEKNEVEDVGASVVVRKQPLKNKM